ncbi:hypothetical protein BC793_103117 [Actinoplanes xinjiangensis]|uniref:Uncharacterized protein n=1 Tax=Actinoplanes xinjiangensis TaxID=512350 RepID=A0A316FR96_9ACTN|nr:hypothetical protein BC793_103117 [Actinoplanes xinjiangensis]
MTVACSPQPTSGSGPLAATVACSPRPTSGSGLLAPAAGSSAWPPAMVVAVLEGGPSELGGRSATWEGDAGRGITRSVSDFEVGSARRCRGGAVDRPRTGPGLGAGRRTVGTGRGEGDSGESIPASEARSGSRIRPEVSGTSLPGCGAGTGCDSISVRLSTSDLASEDERRGSPSGAGRPEGRSPRGSAAEGTSGTKGDTGGRIGEDGTSPRGRVGEDGGVRCWGAGCGCGTGCGGGGATGCGCGTGRGCGGGGTGRDCGGGGATGYGCGTGRGCGGGGTGRDCGGSGGTGCGCGTGCGVGRPITAAVPR